MAGGPGDARRRTRPDDAGTRRAAGQCRVWLAGAGVSPSRSTTPLVADRLAQFEIETTGLRGLCPEAGGRQRGRDGRARRCLDRQAVLQRTAATDDRFRRRDRRAARAYRTSQAAVERMGIRRRGCWTSSARGNGRSPAGPARSSAPSSANAVWDCPESRARSDGQPCPQVPEEFHDELRSVAADLSPRTRRCRLVTAGRGRLGGS